MTSLQKISDSDDTVSSCLDIFAKEPTHTSILDGRWVDCRPTTSSYGSSNVVEILVPGTSEDYTDLARSYLYTKVKVTNSAGADLSNVTANVLVAPGDIAAGMWEKVELYINDKLVEFSNHYSYKMMFESLMFTSSNQKNSLLKTEAGWSGDKNMFIEPADYDATALNSRKDSIKNGKNLAFMSKLHLGMFNQDRLLFANNDIKLRLYRNGAAFMLNSTDANPAGGAKVELLECKLVMRHCKVNPSIQDAHNSMLINRNPAAYFFESSKVSFHTLTQGITKDERKIQEGGFSPTKIFLGLLKQTSVDGRFDQNPYCWNRYGLKKIDVRVNGVSVGEPIEYTDSLQTVAYMHAMQTARRDRGEYGGLSMEEYEKGRTLYGFDLTGDLEDGQHLLKSANISVSLSFEAGLTDTLSLFVYTVREESVYIDLERKVLTAGGSVL